MKIIFLDFDGVLHDFPPPQDSAKLFCNLPRLEAVLREYVNVQIVISSSWRQDYALPYLKTLFSQDIEDAHESSH
ncbi:HAD domain-containing protein [Oxalicibacterium solurbis]|uniref:HAD domain-containing protein n=1 Tax=Oxalicibacterium solurbis TaxID=69280 RepID=UPI0016636A0D|nr:HAD domain-containing protein [Oxalicibacterium solurbis]